jgi:hypothetical protein
LTSDCLSAAVWLYDVADQAGLAEAVGPRETLHNDLTFDNFTHSLRRDFLDLGHLNLKRINFN